ncbi:hypothetical protein JOC77_003510 [Peribacillus deserti]|uniref:Uncharacterized protein n=1 Tax=Peribacillus deserti TaxID=673318 RepID=A0ABS2QLM4_9BACI|nr:hypothetical protein [Peribacillus deserti]
MIFKTNECVSGKGAAAAAPIVVLVTVHCIGGDSGTLGAITRCLYLLFPA